MHNNNLTYADVDSLVKKYIQFFPDAHKKLLKSFSAEEKQRYFSVRKRHTGKKHHKELKSKHYGIAYKNSPYSAMHMLKMQALYKRKKLSFDAISDYMQSRYSKKYGPKFKMFNQKIVKYNVGIGFLKFKQFFAQKEIFYKIVQLKKQLRRVHLPIQLVKDVYMQVENLRKSNLGTALTVILGEVRKNIFNEYSLTCNTVHVYKTNVYQKVLHNEAINKKILNLKEKLKLLQAKHKKELRAYTIRKYVV